jgi:hypothetical protein
MPASIFSGNDIKLLKKNLDFNGEAKILSGTVDPSSSATSAPIGSLYLNSSNGNIYKKQDAGSSTNWVRISAGGDSGVNYIGNPDAEQATTGWATYADAADISPVNGTGGSPNTTWTRNTTAPLIGTGDFLWTKSSGASRQGEGVSYDFTINKADKAKILRVSFDYIIASGTFTASDGITAPANSGTTSNAGNSTIQVFVYDVTNSVLIQVSPALLTSNSTTIPAKFVGYFQTASDSTSYRLILHTSKETNAAMTAQFDKFYVGPEAAVIGAPASDWQQFTMSITGSTSNPTKGTTSLDKAYWRRVGDSMEIRYEYRQTVAGASGTGNYIFNLPSGYSMDTNKITVTTPYQQSLGDAVGYNGTTVYALNVAAHNSTSFTLYNAAANSQVGSAFIPLGNADASYGFQAIVPIAGWGSTTLLSQDADTRVIAAHVYASGATTLSSGAATVVQLNTVGFDSHGAHNTGTYRYYLPVSGYYQVSGCVRVTPSGSWSKGNQVELQVYKNGSITGGDLAFANAPVSDSGFDIGISGSSTIKGVAGDYIELRVWQNQSSSATAGATTQGWMTIAKVSGPSTIAASEKVAAKYYLSGNYAIGANDYINFDTKIYDTHSAVTTGTGTSWKFTVPSSGFYEVKCSMREASGTIDVGLRVNGSTPNGGTLVYLTSGATAVRQGTTTVKCVAGDTISVLCANAVTLTGDSNAAFVSIEKN